MANKHRIVQLTDQHLFADPEGTLLGLNTRASFLKVFDKVKEEQSDFDILLSTGDTTQDGSSESYQWFLEQAESLGKPVYWIPGNHDLVKVMQKHKAGLSISPNKIELGNWVVLLLDSCIEGKVPGLLTEASMALLKETLAQNSQNHILISMHHQPIPVGSKWMDNYIIGNHEAFAESIKGYDQVKMVLFGHVHQDFQQVLDGVHYIATPSTCFQFKANSDDYALDEVQKPGYRFIDLYDDGSFQTELSLVEDLEFEVDYSSKGY